MQNKIKKSLFLGLIIFITSCSSYNVVHVDSNNNSNQAKNGYYYYLPQNIVKVEVSVTKTTFIPGPYAEYAKKYLGIKNAIEKKSTIYDLTDIQLSTSVKPDPNQYYFIDLSKDNKNKFSITTSELGIIEGVNDNSNIEEQNVIVKKQTKNDINNLESFKYFTQSNLMDKIDTVIQKIKTDTAIVEQISLQHNIVEKTLEQKAKEAADFLINTKQQHLDIITGNQEIPYTEGTLKFMNDQLENIEKEYTNLFTGITNIETIHYYFYYTPDFKNLNTKNPLFKFSTEKGIISNDETNGDQVYLNIISSHNSEYLNKTQNSDEKEKKGIYYRIPESANFKITKSGEVKADSDFLISQFGKVLNLPNKNIRVQFYPNTGAIKKVELK